MKALGIMALSIVIVNIMFKIAKRRNTKLASLCQVSFCRMLWRQKCSSEGCRKRANEAEIQTLISVDF